MNTKFNDFQTSALGFTKSPLGIIALFIVLIYGFATLAATLHLEIILKIPLYY